MANCSRCGYTYKLDTGYLSYDCVLLPLKACRFIVTGKKQREQESLKIGVINNILCVDHWCCGAFTDDLMPCGTEWTAFASDLDKTGHWEKKKLSSIWEVVCFGCVFSFLKQYGTDILQETDLFTVHFAEIVPNTHVVMGYGWVCILDSVA